MKVLLLHEFSGVHTELKSALRKKGVSADIATFGDYHKKFYSDYYLGSVEPNWPGTFERALRQLHLIRAFRKYDIIQSISPAPFNKAVSRLVEPFLVGKYSTAKYVYLSAGADVFFRENSDKLSYAPPSESISVTSPARLEKRIAKDADAIVSCLWDYKETLRLAGLDSTFIPLPVDMSKIEQVHIGRNKRLVVYHPLNRNEGNDFKGTSYIRKAFEVLRQEFSDSVDFVERGGMSIEEYQNFTKKVDIIVDQTNSYTFGMSALYGLARGQVVLSGNEPATHDLKIFRESPVINIKPNVENIVESLRKVILERENIIKIGESSRSYAYRYHDSPVVADQYLSVYEKIISNS